jgi:Membrane protein involved in the export of O-antigen and teichoic acid
VSGPSSSKPAPSIAEANESSASLTKSALQGVVWNYSGIAVLIVVQVASTMATARLIAPSWFGVYAAAQAASGLAAYFTFTTVSLAVLRRSELGEKTVGSAVVISLVAATLVLVALWFLAPAWAQAWNIPAATRMIRVLAVALFFNSLASVPIALTRRRLRFGVTALVETSTQVSGIAVGVVLAIFLHTTMALAIGQVVGGVTLFIGAVALAWRDLRFGFDRGEGRELLTYGGQLSGLYFSAWAINAIPSWFTSLSFGKFTLGLYNRASLVVNLPLGYLSTGITKVLFPLYGHVRDDAARTKAMLSEGIVLATGFIWPLFAIVAGAAPVLVDILLGQRWHGTAPLLRLFVLIACGVFPTTFLTNAAEALGWIKFAAFRLLVLLALLGAAVTVVGVSGLGLQALLVGAAIAQWATYVITLKPFVSRGIVNARLVLGSHLIHGSVSLAAFGAAFGCAELLAGIGLFAQALGEVVLTAAVCALVLRGQSWYPATRVLAQRMRDHAFGAGLLSRLRAIVLG